MNTVTATKPFAKASPNPISVDLISIISDRDMDKLMEKTNRTLHRYELLNILSMRVTPLGGRCDD